MSDLITAVFIFAGSCFAMLAAIGITRMPDLYIRMQTATKAGTMGVGCLILALAVHFGESGVIVRSLLVVVFLFITAPVGAHLIGRAAYKSGFIKTWDGTIQDDLDGRYDKETEALKGMDTPPAPDA